MSAMNLFVTVITTLACLGPLTVQAQLSSSPLGYNPEGLAYVITGDFNGDGYDDVMSWGQNWMYTHALYLGGAKYPYLTRKFTSMVGNNTSSYFGTLRNTPVFQGGYMYVPVQNSNSDYAVQVWQLQKNNTWLHKNSLVVYGVAGNRTVNSIAICKYHADTDSDKKNDVFVTWGDTNNSSPKLWAAVVSPSGISKPTTISTANLLYPDPNKNNRGVPIAGGKIPKGAKIHRATPEGFKLYETASNKYYKLFLSGTLYGTGFGSITVKNVKLTFPFHAGLWGYGPKEKNAPTLAPGPEFDKNGTYYGPRSVTINPTSYGRYRPGIFNVKPFGMTSMDLTQLGEALVWQPWVHILRPYFGSTGDLVYLSSNTGIFQTAEADYDGDGIDEIGLGWGGNSGYLYPYLLVGEPSKVRKYYQVFTYKNQQIYHAAAGDFNGDNKMDLLVSTSFNAWWGAAGQLGLLKGAKVSGKPSLIKVY